MEKEIIKILESYFDNYVGLKENHRAIDLADLPEIAKDIADYIRNELTGIEREALNFEFNSKRAQKIDWCRICSCEPDQCVFKSRV